MMTAARPSRPQTQQFIKGVTKMSRTSNMSTPRHPEVPARLQHSGFKISIGESTRGSCECEARNKLIGSGEGEFLQRKLPDESTAGAFFPV